MKFCKKSRLTGLCVILMLVGCGGSDDGGKDYDTQMVTGVVTLDGKPVTGATVTFTPVDDKGAPATGMTDEQGNYTLTTIGGGQTSKAGSGAVAGEYYVGVVKKELPGAGADSTDDPNYGKQPSTYPQGGGQNPGITYIVPKTYENPRESGIKATVKEGENEIPIKLEN